MPTTNPAPHAAEITARQGDRPRTTPRTPHVQLDQFAPPAIQSELWRRMTTLPDVTTGASLVSAPTSRAVHLAGHAVHGPRDAFMAGTEFAHLHGDGSGSLHLTLPPAVLERVIAAGRGEPHPAVALGLTPATSMMLFAPRDTEELDLVWTLVRISHRFAAGTE